MSDNENTPLTTFEMRRDDQGWTVYDERTGEPARVNGVPQTGLNVQVADELVELLYRLEEQKAKAAKH